MPHFLISPEVAGGLGENTDLDTSVHPPVVRHLHYEFADWLGDVLLETFPAFIITEKAARAAQEAGLTGFSLASAEISVTDEAREMLELDEDNPLPDFAWLKPHGAPGRDDFGQLPDARLVISEQALELLRAQGLNHATAEPYAPGH